MVTKEINGDVKEMVKRAHTLFNNGSYDTMIVLTDNSMAANIAFNKLEGTNAAVCDSVNDAVSARDNDANVIIMKDPDHDDLQNIIATVMKKPGMFSSRPKPVQKMAREAAKEQPKAQHSQKKEEDEEEEMVQNLPAQSSPLQGITNAISNISIPNINMPQLKPPPQQSTKESYVQGPKRAGVMGWLKDELGIMDEKPSSQSQSKKSKGK